ncbi:MAG: hypothetical protein FJ146_19745 [Deltaproteobacteria bacterium]|nr:hypothetical protein [Deltaproteobacteria bacterium]
MRMTTKVITTLILGLGLGGSFLACGNGAQNSGGNAKAPAAAKSSTVTLTWDARAGKAAQSFNIFGMPSPEAAEVPITSIKADAKGFDPKNPSAILSTTDKNLKPYIGKNFCFTVTAVVDGVESASSQPACQKL